MRPDFNKRQSSLLKQLNNGQEETIEKMLNQDFCVFLEYEICKAFEHSDNDQIKGFWCDGVLLNQPNYTYSQKFVNDNRQVKLKAFIGKGGQTEYELILRFGKKAPML
jgi:hypothetical protein